jgi:hypothetical protein
MDNVTFGKYQLTEKRESIFGSRKVSLHFHKVRTGAIPSDIKFNQPRPNGDMVIECEEPLIINNLELGAVYEVNFKKVET